MSCQFRGADGLADVPLGMFGDVGQEANHGGWQPLPAYFSRFGEICGVECADYRFGVLEAGVERAQEFIERCSRLVLGMERGHLRFGELFAL